MPKVTVQNIKSRPNSRENYVRTAKEAERVTALMATGLTVTDIARLLRMPVHTLQRLYRYEIATGHAQQVEKVATTMYAIATNPNHPRCVTAGMYILKARAKGWGEKITVQGPDGGSIQVEHRHSIETRDLSPEQRESLREILQEVLERRKQMALEAPQNDDDVFDADFEEVGDDDAELVE